MDARKIGVPTDPAVRALAVGAKCGAIPQTADLAALAIGRSRAPLAVGLREVLAVRPDSHHTIQD